MKELIADEYESIVSNAKHHLCNNIIGMDQRTAAVECACSVIHHDIDMAGGG